MNNKPKQIEDLPDELFWEIFSYTPAEDILKCWHNLSYHINAILHSVPIRIRIKNNDEYDQSLSFLQQFSSQVTHLRDDRLVPHITVDVRPLVNIRYLYLNLCSSQQYAHIHPDNQPYLIRFFSPTMPWSIYERILFGPDRFPYLKSIGCPRGGSILLMKIKQPINKTIRHLHLHSASHDIVTKFLNCFPSITSLTIDYLYANSTTSTTSFNASYIYHLNIVHTLSSQIDFEEFLSSFKFTRLIELRVTFNSCNFEQLARSLGKLLCLKQFHLKVETCPSEVDLLSIRLMSPWFASLDYAYIIDNNKSKRIASAKIIKK